MTAPAPAAAILVLFDSAVAAAVVITFPPEITLMTGSAERCVLWRRIHKWRCDGTAVTTATPRVVSMITGVISRRTMSEVDRCPTGCGMTSVALHRRT